MTDSIFWKGWCLLMETKRVTFRLEDVYLKMLDKLVESSISSSRTEELRMAIIAEYERVFGQGSSVDFMRQNKR